MSVHIILRSRYLEAVLTVRCSGADLISGCQKKLYGRDNENRPKISGSNGMNVLLSLTIVGTNKPIKSVQKATCKVCRRLLSSNEV